MEDDLLAVAKRIEGKITELEKGRELLRSVGEKEATLSAYYDKSIAVWTMKLLNGVPAELDGVKVVNPQKNQVGKLAKGLCFQEKIDMDLAKAEHKRIAQKLSCIKAELNALQSIYKHLDISVR